MAKWWRFLFIAVVGVIVVSLISRVTVDVNNDKMLQIGNYSRIEAGMTQAEVEALLGGPPGHYSRTANYSGTHSVTAFTATPETVKRVWSSDTSRIEVFFDGQGRVLGRMISAIAQPK